MEARTERLVNEQPPGLFAEHTDRFIVDDDDIDSDTVAESDMSLISRSLLHRVNKNRETRGWTRDKFFIDDDDMDCNTVTESDLSLKSPSFLHRMNDRVLKIHDQSSKDATQDSNNHSLIWGMFFVFNIGSICIHGKELLRKFTFHPKLQGTISR